MVSFYWPERWEVVINWQELWPSDKYWPCRSSELSAHLFASFPGWMSNLSVWNPSHICLTSMLFRVYSIWIKLLSDRETDWWEYNEENVKEDALSEAMKLVNWPCSSVFEGWVRILDVSCYNMGCKVSLYETFTRTTEAALKTHFGKNKLRKI